MHWRRIVKKLAHSYYKEVISIRRHLHAHPELSFAEIKTARFITKKLKEYKIPFQDQIAKTGIVALIEGQLLQNGNNSINKPKKVVGLRADMDALPIYEENEVDYKSKNKGIMHACGHDVHTACLLGTAKILSQLKNEFSGTVKLIFQPSEEKLPGGASSMIKEGVLKNPRPDVMIAQHVYPYLEAGTVGFKQGKYMASADEIYITIKGKGGHAAMPEEYINPILIASEILITLRDTFSSSQIKKIPTVIAFGKIIADGATNVIPGEVKIEGTFRTMDENWRKSAHQKIKNIAKHTAQNMGGCAIVNIHKGYPCLVNDEQLTINASKYAEEYLGKQHVEELQRRMTSEDFAFFSEQIRSCFYRLGVGNKSRGITSPVHTPTFNIDEKSLETGMGLMAWITLSELGSS